MENSTILKAEKALNILELFCIGLLLFMAFAFQIVLRELPCPLCLLQRFGFLLASFGLLMNIRFGFHPSHYALTLISALFTAFVALRQIALHVVPGTGAYGDPVFGFHMYTWCFIISMVIVLATTLMLSIDRQYEQHSEAICKPWVMNALFAIIAVLVVMNIVNIWMQCGFSVCPDNPLHYAWTP